MSDKFILIAGRPVKVRDRLYHSGHDAWGIVKGYDPTGPAKVELTTSTNKKIEVLVQNGGYVKGTRRMYWHAPVMVDLPFADITHVQNAADNMADVLKQLKGIEDEQNTEQD